jgi:hypothetical protein
MCQPTVLDSHAAELCPMLCLLRSASCTRYHADSFCRGVTRVLSLNGAAGSLECATRFKLLACHLTSHVAPARTRICKRLRRALIRSHPPPVLNERFRSLAVHTLCRKQPSTFGGTPSDSGRARYGTACLGCCGR